MNWPSPAPVVDLPTDPKLPTLNTEPWAHQAEAFRKAVDEPGFLLAMDMGCGKSLTAIALLEHDQAKRVLVLCPKSVVPVWGDQLEQHSPRTWHTWSGQVIGARGLKKNPSVDERAAALIRANTNAIKLDRPFAAIVNYEASFQGEMAALLLGTPWDAVICDESHRLKSPSGKASRLAAKATTKVRDRNGRVLGLTGTPMPHALSLDSPILTPTGWKPMGEIREGDSLVSADGQTTEVVGVWPQGQTPIFRATFSDGSWVDCTAEHLWQVTTRGRRSKGLKSQIIRTDELGALTYADGSPRWCVPTVAPVDLPAQDLPLDPYLLGLLLGDGHLGHSVDFTTADPQIADFARAALPEGLQLTVTTGQHGSRASRYRITSGQVGGSLPGPVGGPRPNPVHLALDALGLRELRAPEKFVPDLYLWNDVEARLAVLQGLCDSDGTSCGSTTRFTTTSTRLVEGVKFLVRSLGGYVTERTAQPPPQRMPQGHVSEALPQHVLLLGLPMCPFRLPRKAETWKSRWRSKGRTLISVRPHGSAPTQCITVDAEDGLFVTSDFVVTHNSPLDIWAQFRMIDGGKRFGTNYRRFCAHYGDAEQIYTAGGIQRTIFKDLRPDRATRFAEVVGEITHRVGADEVLDLPEVTDRIVGVELSRNAQRAYDELERHGIHEAESGTLTAANAMVLVLRLAQAANGFGTDADTGHHVALDPGTPPNKASALGEILEDLPLREPVVVFARFHADLDAIRKAAENSGRTYGELSGRRRDGLTDNARMNPGIDVLGAQLRSGGVGIDLTRARIAVRYSQDFALADHMQSRARLVRPGQNRPVLFLHILARDTVDYAIRGALAKRAEVVDAVIAHLSNLNGRKP